jgi:GNAT superfamily N-acetyltransferase
MEIKKTIKQSEIIKLSVEQDGKEVGRASLCIIVNDLHKEPYGLLEDVFVDESMRGQGVGTELVQAVIDEAKEHGCYKLLACSRHEKPKVHELYQRLGFKDHGIEFRMEF